MSNLAACAETEAAIEWLLALDENPHDVTLQDEFMAWLNAGPSHALAWKNVANVWQDLGDASVPSVTVKQRPKRPYVFYKIAAAIAIVALSVHLVWRPDYVSDHGQIREVILTDGSKVTLAPNSAVNVTINDEMREVTLLKGEAFFEVMPDASRPFYVATRALTARVVGTSFNVALQGEATSVALKTGRLLVEGSDDLPLTPGEQVTRSLPQDDLIRSHIAPAEIGAWQTGALILENVDLETALSQLGPWHPAWIKLINHDLAQRKVTGVFHVNQPDQALEAILMPFGAEILRPTPWTVIIK